MNLVWSEPWTVMQSAPASYASAGRPVNSAMAVRTLEATFFIGADTCEEMDKSPSAHLGPGQLSVLALERALDLGERLEGLVQRGAIVRRHHARTQKRASRGHDSVHRAVGEHARVIQRSPQERGLPIVSHEDRDDRRDDPLDARVLTGPRPHRLA